MSFTVPHLIVRVNGHFGGSETDIRDTWSTGFRARSTADLPFSPTALQTLADGIRAPLATFHNLTLVNAGLNCWMDEVTIARLDVNGQYDPAEQETTRAAFDPPENGASASVNPWSEAQVISLRTQFPRGLASNGRMYWPATAVSVEGVTGRRSDSTVQQVADLAATLLSSCNAFLDVYHPGLRVAVMSQVGSGRSATVTSVRLDNRLDTQERRENQTPSVYLSAPVTGP